ncbi:MAG: hypothetical protein NVS4B8_18490 [Herpetosiphon sp.]
MDQLKLPDLYCPFVGAINRPVDSVEQATNRWARQMNLLGSESAYRQLAAARLGWLAASTHPTAAPDMFQLMADWCTWFFAHDDVCDEAGVGREPADLEALNQRFLAILNDGEATATDISLVHGLANLWERTRMHGSEAWRRRFGRSMNAVFKARVWEAENRAQQMVPDVHTYVAMRPLTSGMHAYIDLIEIAERIVLPEKVRNHPVIARLNALATSAACWTNDIVSCKKELLQGDVHNVVLTMSHEYKLPMQQALDRAAALHDTEVRTFVDEVSRLPGFGPEVDLLLGKYISVLRSYIRGNLDWSFRTSRYWREEQVAS